MDSTEKEDEESTEKEKDVAEEEESREKEKDIVF